MTTETILLTGILLMLGIVVDRLREIIRILK